ncbi:hypothetical protein KFU94_61675 [Chloroflexi bacterium TSY]|nr:hypothetical protein [Chloroflexi bacterium TSY]
MIQLLQKENLKLQDMQEFHRQLDQAKNFEADFIKNVGFMAGEIGEAVNAYRHLSKVINTPEEDTARTHLGEELADCLAYILKMANYGGIDLQDAYVKKMTRNVSRTWHGVDVQESVS